MKPQALAEKTRHILPLLSCPLCGQPFSLTDSSSLVCTRGHCYDLSRKGYCNLAPHHNQQAEKYDADLFACRAKIFADGFYQPVMEAVAQAIGARYPSNGSFVLLDVGCGEGAYARELQTRFPNGQILGIDLSRDAIWAAAKQSPQVHWLVGNLGNLPLRDHSVDILLDVLTPADYGEFSRVLSQDGLLLKIVPGKLYLAELRACLAQELRTEAYDNTRVLAHLQKHATLLDQQTLRYTRPVTPEQAAFFARMTPMTFGIPKESLPKIAFSQITLDVELLLCRMG